MPCVCVGVGVWVSATSVFVDVALSVTVVTCDFDLYCVSLSVEGVTVVSFGDLCGYLSCVYVSPWSDCVNEVTVVVLVVSVSDLDVALVSTEVAVVSCCSD